jgi:8-oxo-dGTP pyrophosphatase MutT (NUDIX family)
LLVKTTGGRWTFPKGGIEEERGVAGSAAQEALEEAGVSGVIEPQPLTYYLHGKRELKASDEKAVRFCVAAFLMEVTDGAAATAERGRTPTWFGPQETIRHLAEDRAVIYQQEFRRVIDAAVARLAEHGRGPARG